MEYSKGDILEATDRSIDAGMHYIIYLEQTNEERFIGAMLTGLAIDKNELMPNEFFHTHSETGKRYKIPSKQSHLVKAKLIKLESWGPFRIVGSLTEKGLRFVLDLIDHLHSETWEEYLKRTN
ncbi:MULTISPECIES: hypothetical protein [unclassified Pedobacter]|uniref:hypothetical protein n=1 Tax=unclassified Pedobacter TaxID=2628915 RepID=UPI001DE66C7C|nr:MULTISPECIES: hypothetical protein [unclassified Pedobacter]CAH0185783.1 hypothetical protein SRABI36_01624 [Pedobacter sp. Bi36]CAH0241598.1 hypothetical protein SRABI126_02717 [Pedobacter sp. Bi126]